MDINAVISFARPRSEADAIEIAASATGGDAWPGLALRAREADPPNNDQEAGGAESPARDLIIRNQQAEESIDASH